MAAVDGEKVCTVIVGAIQNEVQARPMERPLTTIEI
jgi:hypothetical protein